MSKAAKFRFEEKFKKAQLHVATICNKTYIVTSPQEKKISYVYQLCRCLL